MADEGELSALVVRNIGDLEAAMAHARKLDERLKAAVAEVVRDNLDTNEWYVPADLDPFGMWFAAREWLMAGQEADDVDYWFKLEDKAGPSGEYDSTWIAKFLRAGPEGAGVALYLRGNTLKTKSRWKALARTQEPLFARLEQAGFERDEEQRLAVPLLLDAEAIANGFLEGDVKEALQPVRRAIGIIAAAQADLRILIERDRAMQ